MQQIRWGIIGCGNVTEIKSGPAFNKVPNSKLVAVMRRNAAKAADYAARHGVPKWYADAQQLINDPEVTAVYIATPPSSHEEYTLAALAAGKPVYVEKPMALDAASAQRMQAASEENNVKFSVAHYRREQPLFKKIKKLLEENAIGKILTVNLQFFQPPQSGMIAQTEEAWRLNPDISGGGLFHDLAPHQLDLMLYFFGLAKKASGFAANIAGLSAADDVVTGSLQFGNGALFSGTWCFSAKPEAAKDVVEITGTEGSIRFSVFEQQPIVLTTAYGSTERFQFESLQHVQQPMIQKVVAYFLGEAPNPCSAEDGVSVMKMIDAFTTNR